MEEKYSAQKIEKKWQNRWAAKGIFETRIDQTKEKFYCLEMLPYPSGRLHMGHVRNYSIGDALSWYKRLQGLNVLHPIGWDSFGQPAEQAAIQKGVNPRDWTEDNINQMREQLRRLGISYDWSREIAAHRPEFYKFDQWFFLKMLEMGLAYRKDSQVNWCPKCETTLSNEQASGGVCWRCGTRVEKQTRQQWFLRITDYAEELLGGMNQIEGGWPERVLTMQKNWIGRSEGAFIDFAVTHTDQKVRVFTTRIDTIYGANAIVVAPEHPVIENNLDDLAPEVIARIQEIQMEQAQPTDYGEEIAKDGVDTGLKAVNPFSSEELPVWVGNYVMIDYGTGAVMSVPAHDERDFEFAKKFGLPIRQVISEPHLVHEHQQMQALALEEAFTEEGILVHSDYWNGKKSRDAKREMAQFAEKHDFGDSAVTYRLRDWGISRQRFWGAPIPIIYCETCGAVPVPFEELPVELPESAPFTGVGESPLAKVPDFVNAPCPQCGGAGQRETDTMDTFVDSAWYYFRYLDPDNRMMPFDPEVAGYWTPVEQYIGGVDHAVMHLLYTRFWTKVMRDMGLVKFDEPVKNLLTQGMVVGESYYSEEHAGYVPQDEVRIERDEKGKITKANLKSDNSPIKVAVEKMSKSKFNGVDPDDMVLEYGADAVRIFALFAAPVENELVWMETGIDGAVRFLQRVYRYFYRWHEHLQNAPSSEPDEFSEGARKLRQKTHQTIKRITENFESGQFNTPVAGLMELSNAMGDFKIEPSEAETGDLFAVREAVESLILMLTPYAPHICEELWEILTGSEEGILTSNARFPVADPDWARADELEIPVQVNGKLRSRVKASPDATNGELEELALADEKIREYTDGKQIVKVIVVPKRLVNVVIK
ncbi:MAG: leucine--tRNA ligase [Pyrinomonadaceae bacterium]